MNGEKGYWEYDDSEFAEAPDLSVKWVDGLSRPVMKFKYGAEMKMDSGYELLTMDDEEIETA